MTSLCFDGASHTFLQAVQGNCVTAKYAQTEGPQALSQQTTVKARTIDGVTNTIFHMAPPSCTPERDPLNPMAYGQKTRSVTDLTALTLCRGRLARSANSDVSPFNLYIPVRSCVNNGSECAPLNFVMASAAFRLCGHHRGRHIALRINSSIIGTSRADFRSS